ncbi:8-oxo-dGTP diphosphatase [Paenibacillus endophyticus]|uniref:8-oxo-dGTP diphosphatase n=1 Tax=Paenibacillus endophyticus TaxID=1294268 RepID=A0A7W5CBK1_9BACL|nr:8-oxo-dGTP diphosphatase [Paenibacillus endophyticus]MBB3154670.1 8-oxo-dGTP diphosphatase [Paenibacillus endophyticus]
MAVNNDCGLYTMCIVQDGDKILFINRPDKLGFPGYLGPGGKVEFPESFTEGAVRELREETGLIAKPEDLIFKGIDEYVVPKTKYRYMVFNYLVTNFEGELLANPPEGELIWADINDALNLPMQSWFKRRLPLFFEKGTFEISVIWDEDNQSLVEDKLTLLG